VNIQVNLMPEARLAKLKNKSRKLNYSTAASLVGAGVLTLIVVFALLQGFLLATYAANEAKAKELNTSIAKDQSSEQKAATLQQNLASFYELNSSRTFASSIFTNLSSATPANITLTSFGIDDAGKVTVSGETNSYSDLAKFAESLTTYNANSKQQASSGGKAIATPVFTNVEISSSRKKEDTNQVDFSLKFDVNIEQLKKSSQ